MVAPRSHGTASVAVDPSFIVNALPDPILVVEEGGAIVFVNPAAEEFFHAGAAILLKSRLDDLVPFDSPLLDLVRQARTQGHVVSEYAVELRTPRIGTVVVNIQVSPLPERSGAVVLRLEGQGIASKMDRQLTHRGAARSVVAMAAVLAHEVKNPLSGIRGAAQLLEHAASDADRELTRLICEETDRICGLVDRMEEFSDPNAIERAPVNIHRVLEHVRKIAQSGFARRVRFIEQYDPSLPPVFGSRDQLIQAFLNLVKNAAEATSRQGGEIVLSTAFRHGVRLAVPGSRNRVSLPLEVGVADNGPGIAPDLAGRVFEPFVTTKSHGTGLGLALVAKIIGDHGGMIEADNLSRGAIFRVYLPVYAGEEAY